MGTTELSEEWLVLAGGGIVTLLWMLSPTPILYFCGHRTAATGHSLKGGLDDNKK